MIVVKYQYLDTYVSLFGKFPQIIFKQAEQCPFTTTVKQLNAFLEKSFKQNLLLPESFCFKLFFDVEIFQRYQLRERASNVLSSSPVLTPYEQAYTELRKRLLTIDSIASKDEESNLHNTGIRCRRKICTLENPLFFKGRYDCFFVLFKQYDPLVQ